jgi:hypothetical protein
MLSIPVHLLPAVFVLPLQRWLGKFPPLFLPFLLGTLVCVLALLGLLWGKKGSWLAVVALVLGLVEVVIGALIAVTTVTMLLHWDANVPVP